MSELNTEIFREFFQNYQWPEPATVTFRLYYDSKGRPLYYSCEANEGDWIAVTAEQYAKASFAVKVVDGQLVELVKSVKPKLKPTGTGTACAANDVTVVVTDTQPNTQWSLG